MVQLKRDFYALDDGHLILYIYLMDGSVRAGVRCSYILDNDGNSVPYHCTRLGHTDKYIDPIYGMSRSDEVIMFSRIAQY